MIKNCQRKRPATPHATDFRISSAVLVDSPKLRAEMSLILFCNKLQKKTRLKRDKKANRSTNESNLSVVFAASAVPSAETSAIEFKLKLSAKHKK
jgi:hypothetical protein